MKLCLSCSTPTVELLRDFGPHPICNRFLSDPEAEEFVYPMWIGQCRACGLVQNLDPVPASELVPAVDWITYNEPEGHLDRVAKTIASLTGLAAGSVLGGVSFKDDTLLARMQQRGFATWRLDLQGDLDVKRKGCGAETIQAQLSVPRAQQIATQRGQADVVIARHILEHAYDLRGFMAAVRALAKPGGYVVFEVPDCTLAFDKHDITTLWEEHIAYFTPATLRNAVTTGGSALSQYECHPYPFENCLVAVTQSPADKPPETPPTNVLAAELSRAQSFSASLPERRKDLREFLTKFRREQGKIALLGAGHLACTWIHLLGLRDLIEFVADDNPHKQGLFMPGSRLPIRGSASLLTEGIKLVLLSVNPEAEVRVIGKIKPLLIEAAFSLRSFQQADTQSPMSSNPEFTPSGLRLRVLNEEVLYADALLSTLGGDDITWLKARAAKTARRRIRICTHLDSNDLLHEMLIVHTRDTYVRPHKHVNKSESFHVITGEVDVVLFEKNGAVSQAIRMGEYSSGKRFYYRLNEPRYHTLLIRSEVLVFHEVTTGPFRREDTVFPSWAPEEAQTDLRREFLTRVEREAARLLTSGR